MAATPDDDDPTHALDDFVRRMRQPAAAPPPAPDLSGLGARLHGGLGPETDTPDAAAKAPQKPRGGVLRSGQRWTADDVEDVPVIDLPRAAPANTAPPTVSLPDVQDAPTTGRWRRCRPACRRPATLPPACRPRTPRQPASRCGNPDPAALQLRPAAHPRLPPHWQPGAWLGALRQVFGSSTEIVRTPTGTAVETYEAHRLLLLWPPQADARPPGRWPQVAWLLTGPAAQERPAALSVVPDDAPLWLLADTADIDWALGAELVLHHQAGLRPFQVDGLRAFIAAEREAVFARINSGYGQQAPNGPVVRG